jgi:PPOX class probable F420-dependent enzyme
MGIALPQSVKDLLEDKAYGHVVTQKPDGSPQITMVWMDVDGDTPQFNTAEGREKPDNLRNNPSIIVTVQSRDNPQAYAAIYGKATVTTEGADAQVDKLANRFLDEDKYPFRQPGEVRVIVKIDVEKIRGVGPGRQPWS